MTFSFFPRGKRGEGGLFRNVPSLVLASLVLMCWEKVEGGVELQFVSLASLVSSWAMLVFAGSL